MSLIGQHCARGPQAFAAWVIASIASLCTGAAADAQAPCQRSAGDHVVIDVRWEDPIGGLAIRAIASSSGERLGIIPSSGIGIAVGECTQSGWCRVNYQCSAGWALAARYLAPRVRRLYRVAGVSPADPDGLNMRAGPHYSYPAKGHIPYDSSDVIVHVCQPSPEDGSPWCLVTQRDNSGWVAGQFVTPIAAAPSVPSPPPVSSPPPAPSPSPTAPSPPADPISRACQMYPNLC